MNVYAISDLHLPGGDKKPMDIFGEHWINHFKRIEEDWLARVNACDIVLLPGDISWAMQLEQAMQDLLALGSLPGHKVLLRGNHDYWWSSITRLRNALPDGMYALQNDSLRLGTAIICGTRGWLCPEGGTLSSEDERVYRRELQRLELSLQHAAKRQEAETWTIAMLHYPPITENTRDTEVTALLEAYGVRDVVYGHLHGAGLQNAFTGEHRGVRYHQVSCDGLGFRLYQVPEG